MGLWHIPAYFMPTTSGTCDALNLKTVHSTEGERPDDEGQTTSRPVHTASGPA